MVAGVDPRKLVKNNIDRSQIFPKICSEKFAHFFPKIFPNFSTEFWSAIPEGYERPEQPDGQHSE